MLSKQPIDPICANVVLLVSELLQVIWSVKKIVVDIINLICGA